MSLALAHPGLPTCENCQAFIHDANWRRVRRGGVDQPRPKGVPTPCRTCPKIPKGLDPVPANAVVLSPRNQRAYWYYLQCCVDNLGLLDQDGITIRNNAIIANAIRQHERASSNTEMLLLGLLGKVK